MKSLIQSVLFSIRLFATSCHNAERNVDTYENTKKDLKGVELETMAPHADVEEFEGEVNNGGLNQYFFNSSGQNCFETLRYLRQTGKIKEAKILDEAINLINPGKLSEEKLIENLRKRIVTELEDSIVNAKLDKLDAQFYR